LGGGIAGLTTALALQHAGLQVKVFEQADTSREEGAGEALWSNATAVLSHLGLSDLLHAVGKPITHIVRYTPAVSNTTIQNVSASITFLRVVYRALRGKMCIRALQAL
jgi:2-polyprenyl-6-methoxyphenol hydroxylase-like FAD-dependent oxidoreductase